MRHKLTCSAKPTDGTRCFVSLSHWIKVCQGVHLKDGSPCRNPALSSGFPMAWPSAPVVKSSKIRRSEPLQAGHVGWSAVPGSGSHKARGWGWGPARSSAGSPSWPPGSSVRDHSLVSVQPFPKAAGSGLMSWTLHKSSRSDGREQRATAQLTCGG